jgi:hypothetical protein
MLSREMVEMQSHHLARASILCYYLITVITTRNLIKERLGRPIIECKGFGF